MRISLWGGPGSRKSSNAEGLCHRLKSEFNIELIQEYVKLEYVFKNRPSPTNWEQMDALNGQIKLELGPIKSGVKNIITDSPILMSTLYAKNQGFKKHKELLEIVKNYEMEYPGINLFLDRSNIVYHQIGRYQDLAAARKIDDDILNFLSENKTEYVTFKSEDLDGILNYLRTCCEK